MTDTCIIPGTPIKVLFPEFERGETCITLYRLRSNESTWVGGMMSESEGSLFHTIKEVGDPCLAELKRGTLDKTWEELMEDPGWVTPIWSEEFNKGP
jgi:hypothetical protein